MPKTKKIEEELRRLIDESDKILREVEIANAKIQTLAWVAELLTRNTKESNA